VLTEPGKRLTEDDLAQVKALVNNWVNPVKYLAIDPGKANGVCGYDVHFDLMFMMSIQSIDMNLFLHQFKMVDKCVCEGYKLYPNKIRSQIYSDLETPRVIGRIENWAEIKKVELIMQPATVKKTGYLWIGKKPLPKSDPKNHQLDAHVHFMFWAVKGGHISATELLKRTMN
jgi:hypothetical protein